jgi:hypothetical protein
VTIETLYEYRVSTNIFTIKQTCGFIIPESLVSFTQTFISNGNDIPGFDFDDFKFDQNYCSVSEYAITPNMGGLPHSSLELVRGRPNRA